MGVRTHSTARAIWLLAAKNQRLGLGWGLLLTTTLIGACNPKAGGTEQPPVTQSSKPLQPEASPLVAELELSNPSTFARPRSPVFVSYYDLGLAADDPDAKALVVKRGATILASQAIDQDGDGSKDGVFILVDLAPTEVVQLALLAEPGASSAQGPKLTQAEIAHKVGGAWQPREKNPELKEYVGGTFQNVARFSPPPEHTDHSNLIRYEGPGIESDKVGYRIYLDERNGFDIFGKKVSTPVLHNVGLDGYESYHHMSDWGMDILKVGQSLGAGGFGFWNGKQVELVAKVQGWDAAIIENGDLYSALSIKYKGWQADAKKLDLLAQFAMRGGSRLVHTTLHLEQPLTPLAIGLVKHPGTELLTGSTDITGHAYTYLASWGKQALSEDHLGMAVLFRKGLFDAQRSDEANYVAVVEPEGDRLDYYFLAAWEQEADGIKTKEAFTRYLEQEAESLTQPPRERLKTRLSQSFKADPITTESALDWAKKLADSELERKTLEYRHGGWDAHRRREPKFEYDIVGLQPLAYEELSRLSPEPKYQQVLEKVTGSYVTESGEILSYDESEYNIDSIAPGRNLLSLYEKTKADKYRIAAGHLRHQLENQPKTSQGAFWHKKRYPSQLWLDGVYMGLPFLARYSTMFEEGKSLDEVVNEFVITRERLRDSNTGLYYHAWDEAKKQAWADPNTGRSQFFWGRGLGWFAMALVDVLDHIPQTDDKRRRPLLDIIVELAPALARYQDQATGTWWQIVDKAGEPGNYRESSASAMFTYFFAKAVRKGYLPKPYLEQAKRGFEGLVKEFITVHADGKVSMTNQCLVAGLGYGRDGSYRYYMSEPVWQNDPKGNGPFILAGVELHRVLDQQR